jgi:hypothetical protein
MVTCLAREGLASASITALWRPPGGGEEPVLVAAITMLSSIHLIACALSPGIG